METRKFDIDQFLAKHAEENPDYEESDDPRVPIMVWVCTGCWDGNMRIPGWDTNGRILDQGIDIDHTNQIRKFHDCPKTGPEPRGKRGNWYQEKLLLPEEIFDGLLESEGVERGPRELDTF